MSARLASALDAQNMFDGGLLPPDARVGPHFYVDAAGSTTTESCGSLKK